MTLSAERLSMDCMIQVQFPARKHLNSLKSQPTDAHGSTWQLLNRSGNVKVQIKSWAVSDPDV